MTKLIYILWPRTEMDAGTIGRILREGVSPGLLGDGARYLQMNIADDRVTAVSPAPQLPWNEVPFSAQVSLWLDEDADVDTARLPLEDRLREAGFAIAGYRVRESLYTEYGENQHGGPRDWMDGERSPYEVAVTLLERPENMPRDEWMRRWFGRQSPMSEAMQPRARYVRNVVLETLTPGSFPYGGIVEESWPSAKHVSDPYAFYGASNPLSLARNIATMVRSVTAFLPITRIPNVMTSEYFLKSPFAEEGVSTPSDRPGR